MTDKTTETRWIKVHSGLMEQEHLQRLGKLLGFFVWLLNQVDWDTGIVEGYRDQDAADHFDVDLRTARRWRKELEAYYLTSWKGDQCQRLVIHRHRNPRLTNPPQMNVPDKPETWVDKNVRPPRTKMSTPSTIKMSTPTYDSQLPVPISEEGEGKKPATPSKKSKQRDLVFEGVLKGSFGITYTPGHKLPSTVSGRVNKCAKALKELTPPATGEELTTYYQDYPERFDNISVIKAHDKLALDFMAWREWKAKRRTPTDDGVLRPGWSNEKLRQLAEAS